MNDADMLLDCVQLVQAHVHPKRGVMNRMNQLSRAFRNTVHGVVRRLAYRNGPGHGLGGGAAAAVGRFSMLSSLVIEVDLNDDVRHSAHPEAIECIRAVAAPDACAHLRVIHIVNCGMSAADMALLGTSPALRARLTDLNVGHNPLGTLAWLRGFTALEGIDATNCSLKQADALDGLAGCRMTLRRIDLSDNVGVGVAVAALSGHRALEDVNLWYCYLTDTRSLGAGLSGCTSTLRVLNISVCEDLATLPDLSAYTALTELRAYNCGLREGAIDCLAAGPSACLKKLVLTNTGELRTLSPLSSHAALESLDVSMCGLGAGSLVGLAGCTSTLRKLKAHWNDELRTLVPLSAHTALEKLDVARCGLESSSLVCLAGCAGTLRKLDISENPELTTLAPLNRHTALEVLCAQKCGLNNQGLSGLEGCAPKLRTLDVHGNSQLRTLAQLSGHSALRCVDASECDLCEGALSGLSGCAATLEVLHVCENSELRSLAHLAGHRELRFLKARRCGLRDGNLEGICGSITKLTLLDIGGNPELGVSATDVVNNDLTHVIQ